MELLPAIDIRGYARMSPAELRQAALLSPRFVPGQLVLTHWETDRAVIGGAVPLDAALELPNPPALAAAHFCERRELGVINLGGAGTVRASGRTHALAPFDGIYLGRGERDIAFASADPRQPARLYLLSYPAHAAHPTVLVPFAGLAGDALGSDVRANARRIFKYFHPGAMPTCQLVMGLTRLEPGSVWNTLPPHTHHRRSEIYLYFDLGPDQAVFHFMGDPAATRHLVVREGEAVVSPPWSIHCGVGTNHYGFVWGMGGENQEFADMDPAPIGALH